jgi:hypothetical protein
MAKQWSRMTMPELHAVADDVYGTLGWLHYHNARPPRLWTTRKYSDRRCLKRLDRLNELIQAKREEAHDG